MALRAVTLAEENDVCLRDTRYVFDAICSCGTRYIYILSGCDMALRAVKGEAGNG